jgi:hypothetical protein
MDIISVAQVVDIPPIAIGASWQGFKLRFFKDELLTVPLPLAVIETRSNILYLGSVQRHPVTILPGAVTNELAFSMPYSVTSRLVQGVALWGVMAELEGSRLVLAEGAIVVKEVAPLWF